MHAYGVESKEIARKLDKKLHVIMYLIETLQREMKGMYIDVK